MNKKITRPQNMSQLDYLWTTYGSYEVSNKIDTENTIPTSTAIKEYISDIGAGITELDTEKVPDNKIKILGKTPDGEELTSILIDEDTKILGFKRHTITQEDIDSGWGTAIGEEWILLETSIGNFKIPIEDLIIKGQESDTIINQAKDGKIVSSIKINNPIINKSVTLKTTSDGLWADLILNPDTESKVLIIKSDKGVECKFNWLGTNIPVGFKVFNTFDEYQLETTESGVIYLVKDVKSIYFNGIKFSSVGVDPQDYYTKEEVYNREQVDAMITPHTNAYTKEESDALYSKIETTNKLRIDLDYESSRALEAESNINKELDRRVTWDESKSKVVLPSGGQLVGIKYGSDGSNPEDGATIAQLSKFDKMDFGSSKYPLNLNVPAGQRPTVQEAGQSGEEAHQIAYLSDIQTSVDAYTKQESDAKYATIEVVNTKVDKVVGKQLSTEDYTSEEKSKLEGIEAEANKYEHPTTSGNKHIPSGGTSGQILVNTEDGTAAWADTSSKIEEQFQLLNTMWEQLQEEQVNLQSQIDSMAINEDVYAYGVEWDVTVADLTLTRIGNPLLHKQLPIQSSFRGCVAQGPVIKYWLNPNNWAYKENGEASVLDGTDGTVKVHSIKFYGKSGSKENKRWVKISTVKIDDTWVEIPELLIDAYRCTVDTTNSDTPKAVSVVNTSAEFRGGANRASMDDYLDSDKFRTDLGKPRTSVSRATMRTYAKNADSELLCYEYYKWIFYWCWVIEYATFNSQAAYNADLTAEGYHQGGLGDGVTTWDNTNWNNYNDYCPLTPCGYCNEFGNFTGVKDLVIPETVKDESTTIASKTFKVPRWRGFDNPFGDIWTNLDGIILKREAANEDSNVYTTTNPEEFTDEVGSKSIAGIEVAREGYIKAFDLGRTGEIILSEVGGSSTTYMCDYHWCNVSNTSLRTLLVGGGAAGGASSGLGNFSSSNGVSNANANVGFRTVIRLN